MERINFSRYFKLHTQQKYFIWNNPDAQNSDEIETDDNDDFGQELWDFDSFHENEIKFPELHENIFKSFNKTFYFYIKEKFADKKVCLVSKISIDEKIEQTIDFYKNQKCDIIFNPAFEYKNASANPSVFFVFNKKLSILKLSTSTKVKDYLRANWDFWISNYMLREISGDLNPIDEVSYFLINTVEHPIKNKIEFHETFWISRYKSAKTISKADSESGNIFLAKKIAKQNGLSLDEFWDNTFLENNKIINNLFRNQIEKISKVKDKKVVHMIPVNIAIDEIIDAKNVTKFTKPSEIDNSAFEKSANFAFLVEQFYPQLTGISGTLLNSRKILSLVNDESRLISFETNSYWYNFFKKSNSIIINELENLKTFINKMNGKKVVWYDFEALSLPFPAIDYAQPFQQIVTQVSIVVTDNGEILPQDFNETNVVFDPKTYSWDNFCKIIDKIYLESADFYVVFNKSYELTRLKEMVNIIFMHYQENNPYHEAIEKIQTYRKKVDEIIAKTIDLKDPFSKYWIVISDLKGFYSIKKIENFINKYNYNLDHLITPYKKLAVKNGLEAMIKTVDRYFNYIGDIEWIEVRKNLQIYCQNDVIAMIMVWDFLKFVYENRDKLAHIETKTPKKVALF
ncbi:DUF2779 domain-containing protein [Mesomycoplasma ovipneumoniae]|uniref:DUF2779 domain-containing protein n=1 Tax=Mesomycoplasma ovipneumoniae TaxID=29562 RepID=UPI0005C6D8CB|nr:DUF2779 domain-containing protein [Mesomycoplasma ovipneumoniae]